MHSQTTPTLPPPINLEMVDQFVQDDSYSVTIKWDHPKLLPPASYRVYVNSQLRTTVSNNSNSTAVSNNSNSTAVSNNSNSTAVSLTNVPRHEVSLVVLVIVGDPLCSLSTFLFVLSLTTWNHLTLIK